MRWIGGGLGGGGSVDTTILHTFLSANGILEGTRARRYNYRDGKGVNAPENFGIYSFIEHERFDFLSPKDE